MTLLCILGISFLSGGEEHHNGWIGDGVLGNFNGVYFKGYREVKYDMAG